jgi:biopolymer transport protein ExbD
MKSPVEILAARAEDEEFQMAPLIDCVFLLLIYFMVTTSLLRLETDLGFQLPGQVQQGVRLMMPDEQIIEVKTSGDVLMNNQEFDDRTSSDMPMLRATLARFREAAKFANQQAMVTIQADDGSLHQRLIDVMNACSAAGITNVSFGLVGADAEDGGEEAL